MKLPVAILASLACCLGSSARGAEATPSGQPSKSSLPRITLPADPAPGAKGGTTAGRANAKANKAGESAAKAAKKDEKPGKIDGVEIPRGERGFLGIQIVESTFKLSFYDAKKKPVAIDMDRAALRWDPKYKVGEERVVLTPSADGKSLSSPKNIRPPYNFKLFITLLKDATEGQPQITENYTIDFRQ